MKKNDVRAILTAVFLMIGNAALAQTFLLQDYFNRQLLTGTNDWQRGGHSNGVEIVGSSFLQLNSVSGEYGWIFTTQPYIANHTAVSLKISKGNKDGAIGICPTLPNAASENGIYDQPNYYRFYIDYRKNTTAPPYIGSLHIRRKSEWLVNSS